MWITVSASVTVLTYGFLFQGTIRTTIRKSPQFFLNLTLRKISAGAMRWLRILALILPWMQVLAALTALALSLVAGLADLSPGGRIGILVVIGIEIFLVVVSAAMSAWVRAREPRTSKVTLGHAPWQVPPVPPGLPFEGRDQAPLGGTPPIPDR